MSARKGLFVFVLAALAWAVLLLPVVLMASCGGSDEPIADGKNATIDAPACASSAAPCR